MRLIPRKLWGTQLGRRQSQKLYERFPPAGSAGILPASCISKPILAVEPALAGPADLESYSPARCRRSQWILRQSQRSGPTNMNGQRKLIRSTFQLASLLSLGLATSGLAALSPQVVINEIHFDPPDK